ncbi:MULTISPECIES: hypothetical protein [Streptomyces]|uniref:hypothetical protein n=1 Tax=Streptomyces TaxID=1883 RepID=UPI0009E871E1|nr:MULTISPECIES: hypothetical protein [Streptomyces]MYT06934.1 hypothetical protein [Streptomyces sp. SID5470]
MAASVERTTRIGVTGHRDLPEPVLECVSTGILDEFSSQAASGPVEAFSALAAGADQLFANLALRSGIPLTAVIPGTDYERGLGGPETRLAYRRLLDACADRVDLPVERTREEAYAAAGRWIVDHTDRLVAVWDGEPARGVGGTGDIVAYASRVGVPVRVLWRPGARRP